jgi:hypothetical protein
MNTFRNKYDAIEKIIFDEGLRISNLELKPEIGKMLVFLNTNHILAMPLAKYKSLKKANLKDLQKFELIADGTGIHWPKLDEDLSLKGLLKDALLNLVQKDQQLVVA